MMWVPKSEYDRPFMLHMINDGLHRYVRHPFEIVSYHYYRIMPLVHNPCFEITLGEPHLCTLGTRGITSPYQMTTFWGITYVIQEVLPQESQCISACVERSMPQYELSKATHRKVQDTESSERIQS